MFVISAAFQFSWWTIAPCMTPCPSLGLSVCVCVCFNCYLHPTSSLPCFLCHSLFLWIDICGKTNQRETSHLSSQINFTPLSALGRIINFTCVLTHPVWGKSSYRGDLLIYFILYTSDDAKRRLSSCMCWRWVHF